MNPPTSWDEVASCTCGDCRALAVIRQRCEEFNEPLFVCDGRDYGRGYAVADSRLLFQSPATLSFHETAKAAIAEVFEKQKHCDVYVHFSSGWNAILMERGQPNAILELMA